MIQGQLHRAAVAGRSEQDQDIVKVDAPHPDWAIDFWIVTHVDLHRTTKVQSFVHRLKETKLDIGVAHRFWPEF